MARKSNRPTDWPGDLKRHVETCLDAQISRPDGRIAKFRQSLSCSTGCELSERAYQDLCKEALVWMIVHATHPSSNKLDATFDRRSVFSPFVVGLLDLIREQHEELAACDWHQILSDPSHSDPLLRYEAHLAKCDPRQRLARGVFYTPRVIARHLVERIDSTLRERFGLSDGLADTATWHEMRTRYPTLRLPATISGDEAFVQILDPAAGTGVFLYEVLDRVHRTMRAKWEHEGSSKEEVTDRWNAYVPEHLLPRLHAIELMPTPSVISQLQLAHALADTGYTFHADQRFRFSIADALLDLSAVASCVDENSTIRETLSRAAFTVVLGNPPFRGISSNPSSWIGKLLRGTGPGGERVASYYEVNGEPLRERKLWLQDDYVKFMRFAQWQIERSGVGVVGFVTNHGYLDNATFRGMRHAMLQTFQQIEVFDLQGNRKKNKLAPDGSVDQGMFDIEQGVAMGVFSRTEKNDETYVSHREVWGSREAKTATIINADRADSTQVFPVSPHYLFVPDESKSHHEYEAGFPLNDVMPVNSTAVVTARDSFVIAFDERTLAERMDAFCDLSISDDEIRERFFTNSRSTKYPPGDTRGWKLAEARKRMAREVDRTSFFHACLYRPFDRRAIFWADWMIDWPRHDVTRHLLTRPNIALIARRQMPPTGECSFFWITDSIALDGLIRSDNRGSESMFPLYLDAKVAAEEINISPSFIAAIEVSLPLFWKVDAEWINAETFGPLDVLHYIYALFNTPTYRVRYRDSLRRDFPRVLIPRSLGVWKSFCQRGEQLTQLHLMKSDSGDVPSGQSETTIKLAVGYPKYAAGGIWLGKEGPSVSATERVWEFQVGAHQVCRKWLRDRKAFDGRSLQQYRQIVAMIASTLELTDALDASVAEAGGWEAAFAT